MHATRSSLLGFMVLLALANPRGGSCSPTANDRLPQAPDGCQIREAASFTSQDQEPVRIAAHPSTGRLYVLGGGGDVTLIDAVTQTKRRVLQGTGYIDQPKRQNLNIPLPIDAKWVNSHIALRATLCLGLAFARQRRMYIV